MTMLGRKIKEIAHCKPREAFSRGLDQAQHKGRNSICPCGEVRNVLITMVFNKDE